MSFMLKQQEKGETFYYDSIAFYCNFLKFHYNSWHFERNSVEGYEREITNTFANAKGMSA